jgi:hypothetical protein
MQIAWTKHIKDPEKKKEFETLVRNNVTLLRRLREILEEEDRGLSSSERSIKDFDQPNWEYRQAFKNGYRSCLNVIKKLTELETNPNVG